jgi:trans-aconitate 2-methyltransferase
LFPRIVTKLAPHGVLAVQMPDNHAAASHQALFATARDTRWANEVAPLVREKPVLPLEAYYDLLVPHVKSFDGWRTTYLHVLKPRADGEHPVVAWLKGSALMPFVNFLDAERGRTFVADYAARIERDYPRRGDGSVLFPFSRIFFVAQRNG